MWVIWRNGVEEVVNSDNVSSKDNLDQMERYMDELARAGPYNSEIGGLLDKALAKWEQSGYNLTQAMNTISCNDVLETIFSFQPTSLHVFVNLEGARAEDVDVKIVAEEGGFDICVRHREARRDKKRRLSAERVVWRSYRFIRPLDWTRAGFTFRCPESILHLMVPGPLMACVPLQSPYGPFEPYIPDPCSSFT